MEYEALPDMMCFGSCFFFPSSLHVAESPASLSSSSMETCLMLLHNSDSNKAQRMLCLLFFKKVILTWSHTQFNLSLNLLLVPITGKLHVRLEPLPLFPTATTRLIKRIKNKEFGSETAGDLFYLFIYLFGTQKHRIQGEKKKKSTSAPLFGIEMTPNMNY